MSTNFRILDLLITVLPGNNIAGDCDPSCDMGTHPNCTMGTDQKVFSTVIDPAELIEMKATLQQIVASIDVALYNRQILPSTKNEKEMLRAKLFNALNELKE